MRNPLAKPHNLGQWLLGSVCWVVSCLGGFCGVIYCAAILFPHNGTVGICSVFGSAALIWGVMLCQVLAVGWRLPFMGQRNFLKIVAGSWLLLLTLLAIASTLLIPAGIIICLAFAADS